MRLQVVDAGAEFEEDSYYVLSGLGNFCGIRFRSSYRICHLDNGRIEAPDGFQDYSIFSSDEEPDKRMQVPRIYMTSLKKSSNRLCRSASSPLY